MVIVGEYLKELCGGIYIDNIGKIGLFKIVLESGIVVGIRRIEVVIGKEVYNFVNEKKDLLKEILNKLKCLEKEVLGKFD